MVLSTARTNELTRGVIPAKAGIYMLVHVMDSRLRGNDTLPVPPFMIKEKIVIIGIGNILRRDDGIGVYVIKELVGARCDVPLQLPKGVEVYDGGLGGFNLLNLIRGAKKAIFVDAIEMGLPPGTVRAFSSQEVVSLLSASGGHRCSLHDTDLLEVIKFAESLDDSPEIEIVGIQPATVESGFELSASLKDSIPRTIQLILDMI